MLPLLKYAVNTTVIAPLIVKHFLKHEVDYSQVLNVLAVASVLNVLANLRLGPATPKVPSTSPARSLSGL